MQSISTKTAPHAIGPYSQAVRSAGLVFLSGQIAIDPATGKLVDGDARAQTERVMENLAAVLEAAGLTFDHVVKTTIYLVDFADFEAVNEVYGRRFARVLPARATVQVAALPRGARIEIDAIASTPQLP
jgi:2-iminobutanoate/2-iminopropanoate deaminase